MEEPTEQISARPRRFTFLLLVPGIVAAIGLAAFLLKRLRDRRKPVSRVQPWIAEPLPIEGLSEEDVAARQVEGRNNSILFKPARSRRVLIRESAFTIFNLGLVAIALVQLLFGKPLDALISAGVLVFSIAATVFQNEFARLRLRDLYEASRPTATVIRGGTARNLDPAEVVEGDALAVGPGELILADGFLIGDSQFVVDESMLAAGRSGVIKANGDPVFAGSFCLLGRGIYEAVKLGDDRLIISRLRHAETADLLLTPIERILRRILTVVLALALGMAALLLFRFLRLDMLIPTETLIDSITVILNLAPASLFFMIVLTYTGATADLSRFGALVPRARSVESLSQVDVVCFSKSGMTSGARLDLTIIKDREEKEPIPEHRARQLLGDFSRSLGSAGAVNRLLVSSFEGSRRPFLEEMPFASVYGWSGLAIDDGDMQGVYILGEPELLKGNLIHDETAPQAREARRGESLPGRVRERVGAVGRGLTGLLRRSRDDAEAGGSQAQDPDQLAPAGGDALIEGTPEADTNEAAPAPGGFLSRLRGSVTRLARRPGEAASDEIDKEQDAGAGLELLFAYRPEVGPLYDSTGTPLLPLGLIPICALNLREEVQPEAIEAARVFNEQGVEVKILSFDPTDKIASELTQAGLGAEAKRLENVIGGTALEGLSEAELAEVVRDHSVIGGVTMDQAAQITKTLRNSGHTVALIGDTVRDIPALLQANLTLIHNTGDPAALSVADIVLMDDSPAVIARLLDRGRRIVNGLIDVLKLYLTQIFYTIGLILLIRIFSIGFPYTSAEGGMVAIFTLAIPAVGLSLWAEKGRPPTKNLARLLTVFVVPAALTIAVAGFLVYTWFYRESSQVLYAQTALMHALIFMGLVLVLFIHPPIRVKGFSKPELMDIRPTALAVVSALLFSVTSHIPLAQDLLNIDPLSEPGHYLVIAAAGLAWAVFFYLCLRLTHRIAGLLPSKPDLLARGPVGPG